MPVKWSQNAWRGSTIALADDMAEISRLVQRATGEEGEEPRAHVSVGLRRGEGDLIFNSVGELKDVARDDGATLARARSIYASIGSQVGVVGVTITLNGWRFPLASAGSVTVKGRDPLAVNGIAPEVKSLLRVAGQPVPTWAIYIGAWGIGVALDVASDFASGAAQNPLWDAGGAVMVVAFAFAVISPWVWPQFEVTDPGGRESAAARARRLLGGSGKWVLAVVAGAFIYAAVDHLFH